jgi:flagellar biosynthetic protein FliR
MPVELTLAPGTLFSFLLVLARVGGALSFVPLPGFKTSPQIVRAVLGVAFTLALASRWPNVAVASGPAALAGQLICEAAVGIAVGIAVAVVLETLAMAAQILGLQAGYAYASTIDPNSEADSGVLLVLAQLIAGMLFFAIGLDRTVLRLFAESLDRLPPGSYGLSAKQGEGMIRMAAGLFSVGFRLAMPVVALLILVDVALALLGRLNAQLQLLSLAFPAKMLTALVLLSSAAMLYPTVIERFARQTFTSVQLVLGL